MGGAYHKVVVYDVYKEKIHNTVSYKTGETILPSDLIIQPTLGPGCFGGCYPIDGKFYLDKECTQEYKLGAMPNKDLTLYVKLSYRVWC